MKIVGIIPARYQSTRFPGKPLVDIQGKTMIQRVFEQVSKSRFIDEAYVATDDERIFNHVKEFTGHVVMTSNQHPSGTDRCFEALEHINKRFDFIINIQGDEPFIHPEQIDQLCSSLNHQIELATLIKPIDNDEDIQNPNVVKAIKDLDNYVIYFSRSPIPYARGVEKGSWYTNHQYYKHIGMYAYRNDILEKITSLEPSSLEKSESLEQLRWLENGYRIKCAVTEFESIGIDVPEDLSKLGNFS